VPRSQSRGKVTPRVSARHSNDAAKLTHQIKDYRLFPGTYHRLPNPPSHRADRENPSLPRDYRQHQPRPSRLRNPGSQRITERACVAKSGYRASTDTQTKSPSPAVRKGHGSCDRMGGLCQAGGRSCEWWENRTFFHRLVIAR
jgi:hypothetical protein